MQGLGDARFWLDLVQWLMTIGIGLYVWAASRHRATRDQITALRDATSERADRHADRLTRLEANLQHVPSRATMDEFSQRLGQLHGDFQNMAGQLEGMKGQLSAVEGNVRQLVDNELRSH